MFNEARLNLSGSGKLKLKVNEVEGIYSTFKILNILDSADQLVNTYTVTTRIKQAGLNMKGYNIEGDFNMVTSDPANEGRFIETKICILE